jgi:hypothetical protein
MLNPDDVRSMLDGLGAAEVRRQFEAGEFSGDVERIAARWLASSEYAAREAKDRELEGHLRALLGMRLTVQIAAIAALASAVMSAIVLMERHW